jgi:hypothetical protein
MCDAGNSAGSLTQNMPIGATTIQRTRGTAAMELFFLILSMYYREFSGIAAGDGDKIARQLYLWYSNS